MFPAPWVRPLYGGVLRQAPARRPVPGGGEAGAQIQKVLWEWCPFPSPGCPVSMAPPGGQRESPRLQCLPLHVAAPPSRASGCPARPGQGCRGSAPAWRRGQGRQGQGAWGCGSGGPAKDHRAAFRAPTRGQSGGGRSRPWTPPADPHRGAGSGHQAASPEAHSDHRLGSTGQRPQGLRAEGYVWQPLRTRFLAVPPRSDSGRLWDAGSLFEKLTSRGRFPRSCGRGWRSGAELQRDLGPLLPALGGQRGVPGPRARPLRVHLLPTPVGAVPHLPRGRGEHESSR